MAQALPGHASQDRPGLAWGARSHSNERGPVGPFFSGRWTLSM